jgi:hypothetical protein
MPPRFKLASTLALPTTTASPVCFSPDNIDHDPRAAVLRSFRRHLALVDVDVARKYGPDKA